MRRSGLAHEIEKYRDIHQLEEHTFTSSPQRDMLERYVYSRAIMRPAHSPFSWPHHCSLHISCYMRLFTGNPWRIERLQDLPTLCQGHHSEQNVAREKLYTAISSVRHANFTLRIISEGLQQACHSNLPKISRFGLSNWPFIFCIPAFPAASSFLEPLLEPTFPSPTRPDIQMIKSYLSQRLSNVGSLQSTYSALSDCYGTDLIGQRCTRRNSVSRTNIRS